MSKHHEQQPSKTSEALSGKETKPDAPPDPSSVGYRSAMTGSALPDSPPFGDEERGHPIAIPQAATLPGTGPNDARDARLADLEQENARLVLRIGKLSALVDRAKTLRIGESIVVDEDGTFETVVLRRKRSTRPTGRYVPKHHYRFSLPADDAESLELLAGAGAAISDGAAGTRVVALAPNVRPLKPDERPAAYDLPAEVARHGLEIGALEEEVA